MSYLNIDPKIRKFVNETEKELVDIYSDLDKLAENNQLRVLDAMQNVQLSERHFLPSTGYGYNDQGREAIENIFAEILRGESALVRPHISSGTHAIACALYGNLRPGDEILAITGSPYDTVRTFIDSKSEEGNGTLEDLGVEYKEIPLKNNHIDINRVLDTISDKTKMIYLQRSTGYNWREAIPLEEIKKTVNKIKELYPDKIIFLDNCYGEFLSEIEPLELGVDLIAGSLIKNAGGGIAPTGGYVAGKKELVHNAGCRLAAPGVAVETGSTMNWPKQVLQGLFFAPTVTVSAIKNAILASAVYKKLGFEVRPEPDELRNDIIQSIKLGDPEAIKIFCQAVQEAAPIDSYVTPEPWDMPGYSDPIIMAAGAFIQGSSIELSADAPIKEPYIVYYQGGLTYPHGKIGVMLTLQRLLDNNFLKLEELK